jgi:hypothetical protein
MLFLAKTSFDPLHLVSQTLETFLPWVLVLGLLDKQSVAAHLAQVQAKQGAGYV